MESRVRIPVFPPYAHLPKRLKGTVLKTVRSSNRRGGSNPPVGAIYGVIGEVINTPDCGSGIRRFDSYMAPQLSASMAVISSSSPREG